MASEPVYVLGAGPRTLRLKTRREAQDVLAAMFTQARRHVIVFSPCLDPALFDTETISELLARFAARHRQNRARFLIEDTASLLRDNVRLVDLARRLSTYIHIRHLGEDDTGWTESYVVVDRMGYLHQPHVERHEFLASFRAPPKAQQFMRRFEPAWTHAERINELHPLGLP